jgi:hypothetical protein
MKTKRGGIVIENVCECMRWVHAWCAGVIYAGVCRDIVVNCNFERKTNTPAYKYPQIKHSQTIHNLCTIHNITHLQTKKLCKQQHNK